MGVFHDLGESTRMLLAPQGESVPVEDVDEADEVGVRVALQWSAL
jgi:hypothetical protein